MAELGRAYIDVHADMDPFAREVPEGARRTTDKVDTDFEKVGKHWGETLAESTSKEFGHHGGSFQRAMEDIAKETHLPNGFFIDRNGRVRDSWGRFSKRFGDDLEHDIENAFHKVASPGGPLDTITTGISDAVGAGFNISGKSPLIGVLIPAVGALADVIGAALQAANAMVAVIATAPALITSMGLQIGVLALAFDGMGKAIQGAFKATNAQELQDAIKGLAPAAQDFVRQLIPIKKFFDYLKFWSQQNFFAAFGDTLTRILASLHPVLSGGFASLATSMGTLFRQLGLFFASPTFVDFVRDVFPATARWLAGFGPTFVALLKSLIGMADAAIPFLERIGMIVQNALGAFTDWLNTQVKSGDFTKWLNDMGTTLDNIAQLFFTAAGFVATFLDSLNKNGGDTLITTLGDALEHLMFVLSSPTGQLAMQGLVDTIKLLTYVFVGLVDILIGVLAAWEVLGESLHEFWRFLTDVVAPGAVEVWTHLIPDALMTAWGAITNFFGDLIFKIRMSFEAFTDAAASWVLKAINWVATLPSRILAAIGDIGGLLWAKGRALIQGFIDGIMSAWNSLRQTAADIAHTVAGFLPGSPAEEGPLSGQGYTKLRGQRMVQDFVTGMDSQSQDLRTASLNTANQVVNFGGIRMEFGGVPTAQEARTAGEAVGAGITSQMTDRDVALQVRMM